VNPAEEKPLGVDERTERLICRLLDGEITPREQTELDDVLAVDPAARLLLKEYQQTDLDAAMALRRDFQTVMPVVAPRRRGGLWVAAATGVLAAAAGIALALFTNLPWQPAKNAGDTAGPADVVPAPALPRRMLPGGPVPGGYADFVGGPGRLAAPQFVDYRNIDNRPIRRQQDVRRDWIGIPSSDQNTIFIIERSARRTRITPISGDF
jgi:anti-sigma factor RsiW